jgi:hypothetical protein
MSLHSPSATSLSRDSLLSLLEEQLCINCPDGRLHNGYREGQSVVPFVTQARVVSRAPRYCTKERSGIFQAHKQYVPTKNFWPIRPSPGIRNVFAKFQMYIDKEDDGQ